MTEAEWLVASKPKAMFEFLQDKTSDRKVRLSSCGCCRLVWEQLDFNGQRSAVELAERFADGTASADEVREAHKVAEKDFFSTPHRDVKYAYRIAVRCVLHRPPRRARSVAQSHIRAATDCAEYLSALSTENYQQASLIRDIFGNPFRPITFLPQWRTSTVLALIQQMYNSRDFSAMPILADALEDAGCADEAILTHCWGPGPHVRGCWVVDQVLGNA